MHDSARALTLTHGGDAGWRVGLRASWLGKTRARWRKGGRGAKGQQKAGRPLRVGLRKFVCVPRVARIQLMLHHRPRVAFLCRPRFASNNVIIARNQLAVAAGSEERVRILGQSNALG